MNLPGLGFVRRGYLSWGSATLVFGGAGLVMLFFAIRMAARLRTELEAWPRVEAHVDSAAVASWERGGHREATYAPRLWISYTYGGGGRPTATSITGQVYSSDYSGAVHAAERAMQRRTATVLVNPRDPSDLTLDPGYTWRFFFGPLLLGALGLFFTGFGALFGVMGLRRGMGSVAAASWSLSRPAAAVVFGGLGVCFLAGTALAVYFAHRANSGRVPVPAQVDSTDVVQETSNSDHGARRTLYAVQLWLAYSVRGRTYHAPVVRGAYGSSSESAARRASAARTRPGDVLVNPADPYDVTLGPASALSTAFIAGVFGLLGVVFVAIGALVWKAGRRKRGRRGQGRQRRRSQTTHAAEERDSRRGARDAAPAHPTASG